ncbi:hypothetical protein HQN90_12395 [Paenibacillus alba]|nr:hypothetical protein [Paenibacillus alba]
MEMLLFFVALKLSSFKWRQNSLKIAADFPVFVPFPRRFFHRDRLCKARAPYIFSGICGAPLPAFINDGCVHVWMRDNDKCFH